MDDLDSLFPIFDRVVQWIVLPLLAVIWLHDKKHIAHEKKFIEQAGEIARALAVLETWKAQRSEDQAAHARAMERLSLAVERLNSRLDHLKDSHLGGSG